MISIKAWLRRRRSGADIIVVLAALWVLVFLAIWFRWF